MLANICARSSSCRRWQRDSVLPRVLAAALKRFGATGNVQDASQTVHNVCESENNRLDSELAILRFSVWVTPALGFVGTVRGIGLALQGAELAVKGDTSAVTSGLGISFNSTLVALTLSIVLMYMLHEIQLAQERLDARRRELRRGRADQPAAQRLSSRRHARHNSSRLRQCPAAIDHPLVSAVRCNSAVSTTCA